MSGFSHEFEEPEEGQQIKARLKWFNATKGFGFVSPVDGSADAFLHVSVLHKAVLQQLGDQAELLCEVGPGPKGPQVIRIIEVLDAGQVGAGAQAAGRGSSFDGYASRDDAYPARRSSGPRDGAYGGFGADGVSAATSLTGDEVSGVVKWFKPDKGFGFITADGSGSDVFVHKSVLMRSGLFSLEAGQRVQMRVQDVEKGREATWVASG